MLKEQALLMRLIQIFLVLVCLNGLQIVIRLEKSFVVHIEPTLTTVQRRSTSGILAAKIRHLSSLVPGSSFAFQNWFNISTNNIVISTPAH